MSISYRVCQTRQQLIFIRGFLEMPVFLERFGIYDPTYSMASKISPSGGVGVPYYFSNVRSGLIVALLSIGTLIGALLAAPLANRYGRRSTIPFWTLTFCIGVVIQIAVTSGQWVGIVMGRWVAGLGVGKNMILLESNTFSLYSPTIS